MKRFTVQIMMGVMVCIMAISFCHAEEIANKTIGISSKQVLKGLKEYLTNSLEDTTSDGLPIQMVTTEYNEVMVELTGSPDNLSLISIDTILSESADEKTDIQRRMITSQILGNIFSKSSAVLEWYEKNLEEGLKQEEAMEKIKRITTEKDRQITLVVVRVAKGYIVGIEIQPKP